LGVCGTKNVEIYELSCLVSASTSEDVTMATWGGSTAGNMESIDEDDDDNDDDDDDEGAAAAGQNGEHMFCLM